MTSGTFGHLSPLDIYVRAMLGHNVKRVVMSRRGDEAVIQFDYDRSLVTAVKGLDRRSFDPWTKEWTIPLHLYIDAVARFQAIGSKVELDGELQAMYDEALVPPPKKPEVTISRCGDEYVVQFEYDPSLVKATKRIPGRNFDPSSRAWFVPIEDAEGTLKSVLKTFEALDCSIRLEPKLRPLVAGLASPG